MFVIIFALSTFSGYSLPLNKKSFIFTNQFRAVSRNYNNDPLTQSESTKQEIQQAMKTLSIMSATVALTSQASISKGIYNSLIRTCS